MLAERWFICQYVAVYMARIESGDLSQVYSGLVTL